MFFSFCVTEYWGEKSSEWKIHCSLIQQAFLWQPNIFKQRLKAAMPWSTSSHTLWSFPTISPHTYLMLFSYECLLALCLCLKAKKKKDTWTVTLPTFYQNVSMSTSAIWHSDKKCFWWSSLGQSWTFLAIISE